MIRCPPAIAWRQGPGEVVGAGADEDAEELAGLLLGLGRALVVAAVALGQSGRELVGDEDPVGAAVGVVVADRSWAGEVRGGAPGSSGVPPLAVQAAASTGCSAAALAVLRGAARNSTWPITS